MKGEEELYEGDIEEIQEEMEEEIKQEIKQERSYTPEQKKFIELYENHGYSDNEIEVMIEPEFSSYQLEILFQLCREGIKVEKAKEIIRIFDPEKKVTKNQINEIMLAVRAGVEEEKLICILNGDFTTKELALLRSEKKKEEKSKIVKVEKKIKDIENMFLSVDKRAEEIVTLLTGIKIFLENEYFQKDKENEAIIKNSITDSFQGFFQKKHSKLIKANIKDESPDLKLIKEMIKRNYNENQIKYICEIYKTGIGIESVREIIKEDLQEDVLKEYIKIFKN